MKKEDNFNFMPKYQASKSLKITDNIITEEDIVSNNFVILGRNDPNSSEAQREQQIVNTFFRSGFSSLRFKPYNNFHIAIRALEAYCGFISHDISFSDDLNKTANELISGCFLLKFLTTISKSTVQGDEFFKLYSIEFENKLLWSETRWRVRYYSNMYKFKIVSGSQNPPHQLISQIFTTLNNIKEKFPRLRAEDLFIRILRIAESTRLDDGL